MDIHYLGLSIALDQDKENGVELIMRFLEKSKLQHDQAASFEKIEDVVNEIDKTLTDIEINSGEETYLLKKVNLLLRNLGKALLNDHMSTFFNSQFRLENFENYFISLSSTIKDLKFEVDIAKIEKKLVFFHTDEIKDDSLGLLNFQTSIEPLLKSKISITELKDKASQKVMIVSYIKNRYLNDFDLTIFDRQNFRMFNSSLTMSCDKSNNTKEGDSDLEWEMLIKTKEQSLAKFGFLIWTFGSALENINGVETSVEDIGKGSIWARVKIKFKDLVAKEEAKQVLTMAREAAVKGTSISVDELKSPGKEEEKILNKSEVILHEKTNYDSNERKDIELINLENKKLDIRRKQAEIHSLELDNQLKKLTYLDTLSTLAAKGLLSVDDLQIDINEILYLAKNGNDVTPGEDISIIDNGLPNE